LIFHHDLFTRREAKKILQHNLYELDFSPKPGHWKLAHFSISHQENHMSIYRKLIVHVLIALLLFAGFTPASAASGNDHQVITETVEFTIPADQCPALPAGVSIHGTGERHMVVNTRTKSDGTTVIITNDLIKGLATDSNGGVHKFVYHNSSTLTIPPSGDYSISMNDVFELSGPGPHYSVSFNWRWTFPSIDLLWPPSGNWEQIHGDPDLIFACDPL
jgi:hypothetical protein